MRKEEIIKKNDEFFANYQRNPKETAKKIELFRRRYSKLSNQDLLKTFTI